MWVFIFANLSQVANKCKGEEKKTCNFCCCLLCIYAWQAKWNKTKDGKNNLNWSLTCSLNTLTFLLKYLRVAIFTNHQNWNVLQILILKFVKFSKICTRKNVHQQGILLKVQVHIWIENLKSTMTWQCFTSVKYNAIPRKIIAVETSSSPYVFKELNLYGKCRKKVSQQHLLTSVLNKSCTENVGSFFFYLGFLSRTFPIHRTAVEGGSILFYSSLPLRTASQALKH